ncbi:uncharacterized protein TNCT_130271 [Trichonephila clavata]|uniref:Uncharacterized protein n=1 Tax=Trichonephila clavata TaxID=2740835 RepID=A0A8X6KCF9_TRICU|nr:uncharacterized protein TNCT_130271 [Trichonephila clavata]
MKELSQKATFLDSISIHFKQHSAILQNLISTYYQELIEGMDTLQKLLKLYHQKLNFQLTSALLFTEESRALQLKMRCLELEAMTATYTTESLEALRIIRLEKQRK